MALTLQKFTHGLLLVAVFVAGLFQSAGCSDDQFIRRQAQLGVSPYTEGQLYASYDIDTRTIDLGEVPIYSRKKAIFHLENTTTEELQIKSVVYDSVEGEKWQDAIFPGRLGGGKDGYLEIIYAPSAEGDHLLKAHIESNGRNPRVDVIVKAKGVFKGAPDIEVGYEGYTGGPLVSNCDASTGTCIIPDANALKFGNIGVGASGSARLVIRNTATCQAYPGAEACTSCALILDKDPAHQNIGVGFKAGTNDQGYFSFAGSTGMPRTIWQRDLSCDNSRDGGLNGPVALVINFQAPQQEGEYHTTIVVESNDADESVVEIPVIAYVRNAPIAVAELRELDTHNPSAPWSDPNNLLVLNRVYLDGSGSYDPRDPTNPSLITEYDWSITSAPEGVNPADYAFQGQGSKFFSFWAPLAGDYVIKLEVQNRDGLRSGATEHSSVTIHVIPGSRLHIELTWDDPTNDQDLHFTHASVSDTLCSRSDCYWTNCNANDANRPIWFNQDPAGVGANPRLDIDDTNGLGPENTNIDNPQPGTYRIYVHYWGGSGSRATRDTIRIWLNGLLEAEYRRTLSSVNAVWAVADITWQANGVGIATPYPRDNPNEIGAVRTMNGCWSEYTFH